MILAQREAVDMLTDKCRIEDLALIGGPKLFKSVISTSNLVAPDIEAFLEYSRASFKQKQYSNNGPNVRLLEGRLAELHQTKHCIAFANGFWAIVLTIKAVALAGKTEIVIPSLTYRRLADIAAWLQLKPHFCEVDANTLAPTSETVAACINKDTAAVLVAHPIVNCCDVEGIAALGKRAAIPVIFDAVESVYESIEGGKIGSFGSAECFSLHASKLINGCEGGYVTTNDNDLAGRLKLMRGFGFSGQDNIVEFGLNSKLCEVHACMALASLDDLEDQIIRNRRRYCHYREALRGVQGLRLLQFDERYKTSYKNIVVELLPSWPLSRTKTLELLHAEGALARPYYYPALHQKLMAYPHVPANLPITDKLAERFMLLPCGHFVSEVDIDALSRFFIFIKQFAAQILECQSL